MQFPQRPQIPNPYQIAGQAVSQLGGQVREYGKEQDQLAENFRLMMEKRAQAELEKQRLTAEQDLKLANEKRQQTEFETKQKAEEAKAKFLQDFTGADPADPAIQARLKQALTAGIIDAGTFKALGPKERNLQSVAGKGLYEIPETGDPQLLIDAPAPRPESQLPGQRFELAEKGQTFQQENTLRDEFNKKTVGYETAATAFGKLRNALNTNNSADAYNAVINFVKTLDPGSTVREGEYSSAKMATAGGAWQRFIQAAENIRSGKLTDESRKNLYNSAMGLIQAERDSYGRIKGDYERKVGEYNAQGYKLNPSRVVSDYAALDSTFAPYENAFPKQNPAPGSNLTPETRQRMAAIANATLRSPRATPDQKKKAQILLDRLK